MKKGLVILMAIVMLFALSGLALADKGNITPKTQAPVSNMNTGAAKDFKEYVQKGSSGESSTTGFADNGLSTHVYGTWNSPYTEGIDGYNYNDAQDYVDTGDQVDINGKRVFQSGPHGGYQTTTHRCRECHAVHRAAGKFKLLRSDTRFEACDWCHGTGAGSGFNIQMDNNDNYTLENNVGHSMGFGVNNGKWKAPDDTFPAFTPNYWMGGFSCFDCHSPHANPQRLLGYNNSGQPVGIKGEVGSLQEGKVYGIANPGHAVKVATDADASQLKNEVVYLSGSWLLIKDPDREMAVKTESGVNYYNFDGASKGTVTPTGSVTQGQEISDMIAAYSQILNNEATVTAGLLTQYSDSEALPVNKFAIDWDSPIGPQGSSTNTAAGFTARNMSKRIWNVSEFCTDCHDGNAGLHTVKAPLFSEDRALRGQSEGLNGSTIDDTTTWKGDYDLAYGHDAAPRH